MEWWQTLLMTAGTCLVTLAVTFLFNYIVDGPKRKKQKEDELNKRLQKTLDDSVGRVNNGLEHVLEIYEKSRQDSIKERQKLYDTIDKINKNIDGAYTTLCSDRGFGTSIFRYRNGWESVEIRNRRGRGKIGCATV